TTTDEQRRGAALSGLTLGIELILDGTPAGRMDIGAAYLPAAAYAGYRALRRATPAPMSDTLDPAELGTPVDATLVGRADPDNVLLSDVAADADAVTSLSARLRVPARHPSLFDHPLDHVPAMVLLEAARQVSILAADPTVHARGFQARFPKIVELDAPTEIRARRTADLEVAVEFVQHDDIACTTVVTLARGVA
ncbi:MAG: hypothetical protein LC635_01355, partial [Pseudonocardiaceae bacterium]|nr:hypothetical protein [Pseudonocardiaceae bacterium]